MRPRRVATRRRTVARSRRPLSINDPATPSPTTSPSTCRPEIDRTRPFGDRRIVRILSGSLTGTLVTWLVVLDDLESPFPTGSVVVDLEDGEVLSDVVPFDPDD